MSLVSMVIPLFTMLITFLSSWQFAKEKENHVMPPLESSVWKTVTIPHDWAIYGPFERDIDLQYVAVVQNFETVATLKTGRTGGLPYIGAAWYVTSLPRQQFDTNKVYKLYFDGAMSEPEVFVNGIKAGEWKYGYNAFEIDITGPIKKKISPTVTIAVRLENKPQSSRWYPGAGLFRKVKLIEKPQIYIPTWGIHITTPYISQKLASVNIKTSIVNSLGKPIILKTTIFENESTLLIDSIISHCHNGLSYPIEQNINIKNPNLWSPESPFLYKALTTLYCDGKELETVSTVFGVRSIQLVPYIGFILNNKIRKFKGVCLHHDLGPLGVAVSEEAIARQLTILKDMGCDAIRTTHNMPSSEFIEACDKMGFMVLCEPFDEWDKPKCENGYHRFFHSLASQKFGNRDVSWAEADMINMIHHFRNNPSIVMWSIGNEIPNQCDTDGYKVANFLQDICKREDGTRPITAGMDNVTCVLNNGFASVLQVVGLNYRSHRYKEAFAKTPQKLILGSETASCVSSRGEYKNPPRINNYHTVIDHPIKSVDVSSLQCSDYGTECCFWSNIPDYDFANMDDHKWTIGQFVWTGFDYLGEPSPYDTDAWPAHSSYFGICDLAGIPKNNYYLYRSQWNKKEHTAHLLPHWNWAKGDSVTVMAYTDDEEGELFLNGKSLGVREKYSPKQVDYAIKMGDSLAPIKRYRLVWENIPWEAGEIKVITKNGSAVQHTCDKPHHIEMICEPDYTDNPTLHFVRVRVVDKNGIVCPNASNIINFTTVGSGQFYCAANGDPTDITPFYQPKHRVFHGEMTVIVKGQCSLTAKSQNLISKTLLIK